MDEAKRVTVKEGEALEVGGTAISVSHARNGEAIIVVPEEIPLTIEQAENAARADKRRSSNEYKRKRRRRISQNKVDKPPETESG